MQLILTSKQVAKITKFQSLCPNDWLARLIFPVSPQPKKEGVWWFWREHMCASTDELHAAILAHWWTEEMRNRRPTLCEHNGSGWPKCPRCGPVPTPPFQVELLEDVVHGIRKNRGPATVTKLAVEQEWRDDDHKGYAGELPQAEKAFVVVAEVTP